MENKNNKNCPYISTIKRYLLDFDLEKKCSISLSTLNIYCCLICGKYFQGRGKNSYAFTHSIQQDHHLFINLSDTNIYCLPEDYIVNDNLLNDIKLNLKPIFNENDIKNLDYICEYCYSLEGNKFLPGFIGLNNVKNNDYFNVIIQAFCHLKKFRNYFIKFKLIKDKKSEEDIFLEKISDLFKKMWNKYNFKEHISPYEILNVMFNLFNKNKNEEDKINENKKINCLLFLTWFINIIKNTLNENKIIENIINMYFTGKLELETFKLIKDKKYKLKPNEKIITLKEDQMEYIYTKTKINFYYLTLELPHTPLFKDKNEKINIPQININKLLEKYNGKNIIYEPNKEIKKRYKIIKLPYYLILIFKRFENNMFFVEKNPTLINFTLDNLIINNIKYSLNSNIIHEGRPNQGNYKIQIKHKCLNEWFEIQDLNIQKIFSETVLMSESYIQFYEQIQ